MTKNIFTFSLILLVSLNSFSQNPNEQEILIKSQNKNIYTNQVVDKKAQFKNGDNDFFNFFAKNSMYKIDKIIKPKNTIYFDLYINETGKVYDFKILRPLSEKYNNEIKRLIKIMPKWKPAEYNDKKVTVSTTQYITFSM